MADDLPGGLRKKPRQDRSELTVARILQAADELFGEMGVGKATTIKIADRADLSVGALYRFFPDKSAIARSLADLYLDDLRPLFDEVAEQIIPGELTSVGPTVGVMVRGIADLHSIHPGYFAVASHLHPSQSGSPAEHVRDTQIEALAAWFSLGPNEIDETVRKRMAEFLIDTTRVLLELTPSNRAGREAHLAEIELMMTAYVLERMGPA